MSKPKKYEVTIKVTEDELHAFHYVLSRADDADYDWKKSEPDHPEVAKALALLDKAFAFYGRIVKATKSN